MRIRRAEDRDLDGLTATLTAAFAHDPLWSWAFPEREGLAGWWRFLVRSALRYPHVWIADDHAAVSVWIPPGGVELTQREEAEVEPLIGELAGSRAPQVLDLIGRFGASHPAEPRHYYLSLLGTHPDHRGKGLGMALLAENLAAIDRERAAAYLESSNPANDARYERHGFRRIGAFARPDEQLSVSTMWREPR
jgi:ribosomal protein S18 acetylase RimI-like enzyme